MSFEKAVIEYLGSPVAKNAEAFTIQVSGKSVTVIPDALLGAEKILEVKNVAYISNSPQLRAYVALVQSGAATKAGDVLNGIELVISPGSKLSQPLYDAITMNGRGVVNVFDPLTKTIKPYIHRGA